jgi:hypothetical protein
VAILFGDDARNRVEVVTNSDGAFLALIPTRATERGGDRTVVAQTADGISASSQIRVIELFENTAGLPGYGLGG